MPTNKIGLYSFITLGGQLDAVSEQVSDITPRGIDGHSFRREGLKGKVVELMPVADFDSSAEVVSAISAVAGLRSTLVTVYDSHGIGLSNVMVVDVQLMSIEETPTSIGGLTSGSFVVTWRMQLQATEV